MNSRERILAAMRCKIDLLVRFRVGNLVRPPFMLVPPPAELEVYMKKLLKIVQPSGGFLFGSGDTVP